MLLHAKRDFDSDVWIVRRRMSDRRDGDLLPTARFEIRLVNGQDDRARAILSPLDQSSFLFFFPEIKSTK